VVDTGIYEALFGQAAELGSGRMFHSSIDRARGPTRSAFTANSDVGGTVPYIFEIARLEFLPDGQMARPSL